MRSVKPTRTSIERSSRMYNEAVFIFGTLDSFRTHIVAFMYNGIESFFYYIPNFDPSPRVSVLE